MKKALLAIVLLLIAGASFADTSYPQGLPIASGINQDSNIINFQVAGEDAAGVISNGGYVSGVGLAAMIFNPLLPGPGEYIPTITTIEGDAVSYPNPFDPDVETATIAYKLAQDAEVKVYIIDISGAIIRTIITNSSSRASDGYSRVTWDGKSGFGTAAANGIYLVQIVSGGKIIGKTKIMIIR